MVRQLGAPSFGSLIMKNPYSPSEVAGYTKTNHAVNTRLGFILACVLVLSGFVVFFLYGFETSVPVSFAFASVFGLPILVGLYCLGNRVRSHVLQIGIGLALLLILGISGYLRNVENQKMHSTVERLRRMQIQKSQNIENAVPREPSDEPKSR